MGFSKFSAIFRPSVNVISSPVSTLRKISPSALSVQFADNPSKNSS